MLHGSIWRSHWGAAQHALVGLREEGGEEGRRKDATPSFQISWLRPCSLLAYLWPPYGMGQAIIFLPCGFFLSSFFRRLISAVVDWMSTIFHTWCGLSAKLCGIEQRAPPIVLDGDPAPPPPGRPSRWALAHILVCYNSARVTARINTFTTNPWHTLHHAGR